MEYTDSNFQSDYDDSRCMLGYIFTLNRGAICWKSSKQHTAADSVCKAEYNVASNVATYSAPLSSNARDRELR